VQLQCDATPPPPLEELTALPRPPGWILGREKKGKGREREGKERARGKKGKGNKREKEKGTKEREGGERKREIKEERKGRNLCSCDFRKNPLLCSVYFTSY